MTSTIDKLFGATPEDAGTSDAVKQISAAQRRAEALAARLLAERECPETVREFGRQHRIEAFAEMTWLNGFQAGMRAAMLRDTVAPQVGRSYRARDGFRVGPMIASPLHAYEFTIAGGDGLYWHADGRYAYRPPSGVHTHDLVAEWIDPPTEGGAS